MKRIRRVPSIRVPRAPPADGPTGRENLVQESLTLQPVRSASDARGAALAIGPCVRPELLKSRVRELHSAPLSGPRRFSRRSG